MAKERGVAVRPVENEPGEGFFLTTIEEGGGVNVQEQAPTMSIEGDYEAGQAYIQEQLKTGVPVVAYRAGRRGQCVVVVNPAVIAVNTAWGFSVSGAPLLGNFTWRQLEAPAYYSPQLVGSYGQGPNTPKLEFTGTNNQTGLPIKITVIFVQTSPSA